jgi:hypothetical protein
MLKNPAADNGSNEPENDVNHAAEPLAARDGAGDPTGEQADDDPPQNTVGLDVNDYVTLRGLVLHE